MQPPNHTFIEIATGSFKRGVFNAIVAPRPIGWISTVDAEGRANLAPFSYFNIVSNDPPVLVFSCNTPEDRPLKDTLTNALATREFVFNLASFDLARQMNMTSTPLAAGIDEFEYAGLEKAPCVFVKAPRVARSPASLECKVFNVVHIANENGGPEVNVVFGKVVGMHIRPDFLDDKGHFRTDLAKPVTRLGGSEYAISQPTFELERQFRRANEGTY